VTIIQRSQSTRGDSRIEKGFKPPEKFSGKIPKRQELDDMRSSLKNPEQEAQWIASRMGYENLATRQRVAERAKAVVQAELAATRTSLEYLRNKWLILYRLYRGETLSKFFYGPDSIHVPEPYKAVETVVPRVFAALFDIEPWHKTKGQTRTYDASAKMMQALIDHQIYGTDLVSRAERLLRTLAIYGTAPGYTWWRQEVKEIQYREVKRVPDQTQDGRFVTKLFDVKREEIVFDGNDFRPIELWDYFAPPLASSVEEAEWVGHRTVYTTNQIRMMGQLGLWENLSELEDSTGDDTAMFDDEYKQRKGYSFGIWDPHAELQSAGVGHYEVFERWGLFDIEDDGHPVECQIVVIQPRGRAVIARVSKNPYWHGEKPYVTPRYTILEGEHFGIGVIEPIAKLSLELDRKRQLELNATELSSNPILVAVDGANIPDEQLVATPGLVLRAPTADGIRPLVIPDVSDACIKSQNRVVADIRETTGAVTTMMGGAERGSETAYEVSSRLDESNVRIKGVVKNFERDWIVPLMIMWDGSNQQFMRTAKVVRAIGHQGLKWSDEIVLTPDKITGRFNHIALPSSRLNQQQVQVQQLVNLLDRAPILNQQIPGMIKLPFLLARIFREGFGIRDVDEIITMNPEDRQMMSAIEEHEAWKYGEVPEVQPGENLMRHAKIHFEFLEGEEFAEIERRDPGTAAKARAHVANTARAIARAYEEQEQQLQLAMQQQAVSGGGGQAGGRGFAGGGQDPGSPKFRREGPSEGQEQKSESMQKTQNGGAS
jgi:hypothetical protein